MKFSFSRKVAAILALASLCAGLLPAAQPVQHLTVTQPGGFPGLPVMTGISRLTNGMQLNWDGPSGYYQVFQKSNSLTSAWLAVGKATNLNRTVTITTLYSNAFFRVSGPAPKYAGSKVCITCHLNICSFETNTPHASAFSNPAFATTGGQTNASCLACHTVGYGLPTGFVSASATPQLENVQCENCHGPAANHAASPDDPTIVPRVEIAATVCGGCHTASHSTYTNPPTFEEWSASGHSAVVPDVLQIMSSSTNNIQTCGVCHSGSARLAMLNGNNPAVTLVNDYNVPQSCVVCHDPHATNANPAQLRNPIFSTNDFHLASSDTATVAAFTNQYNASTNINLCAQCHNDRGAAWTDTARAPHHSVQYNFLLGTVGELPDGTSPFAGAHSGQPDSLSGGLYATNQCVFCHMSPEASDASAHNHSLLVNYNACATCHQTDGASVQAGWSAVLSNQVSMVIFDLNQWAARQTNALLTATNVVAWEYSTPGGLTWQTNSTGAVLNWSLAKPVTFMGPVSAGQSLIATNILKARFNLYLYLNDGSFGVHNPIYAYQLLDFAESSVEQELAK